uniref:Uncharacterized protein n=1 Tax=Nelumbo nucifera TaxID=4432 RepID=A0A822YUQ4_NELNU|nr:TPA_asm: hypothetical protein HUJ06_006463 [Nelumbo nucifera]
MSHFRILKGICRKINGLLSNFIWGQRSNEKKIKWVAWNRMCNSKMKGGLGFRNIKCFNLTLLANAAWRLIQNSNILWGRILKQIYYPQSRFLETSLGSKPSWAWRSLLDGRDLLSKGLIWRIGNGKILIFGMMCGSQISWKVE